MPLVLLLHICHPITQELMCGPMCIPSYMDSAHGEGDCPQQCLKCLYSELWLHPGYNAGSDKIWAQNHPKHQHTLTWGKRHRTSSSPLCPSLCVPRYLQRDPIAWNPLMGATEELQHKLFSCDGPWTPILPPPLLLHQGCSVPTPLPVGKWRGFSDAHSAPPAVPGNAVSTPKGLPPNAQVHCLLPSVCSAFTMHAYSILQLPMGANKQVAFFFCKDRNLVQMTLTMGFDVCGLMLIS